ncbi:MAG TPA: hypothetical protein VN723_02565 [Rhizomicrobium sp.]|nr:hypothetical protein [Rhizomicrobium sp.]
MKRLAIAALSVLLLPGAGAATNWNWFGGTTIKGETEWSFFDSKSIKRSNDGHVQVWTKAIAQIDMNKQKPTAAITGQAVDRLRHNYVPMAAHGSTFDKDQLANVIIYEAIANDGGVKARAEILFEIDCKGSMDRSLSVHIHDGTDVGSTENPGSWSHIVPETSAATLEAAVCN